MRKFTIRAFAPFILILCTASAPAVARHDLGGIWSKGSIKNHCDAAGGRFGTGDDGGYRCVAAGGSVNCTKEGKCVGTDPKRLVGGNKKGIDPVTVGNSKAQK
jgi:hypothetical protein